MISPNKSIYFIEPNMERFSTHQSFLRNVLNQNIFVYDFSSIKKLSKILKTLNFNYVIKIITRTIFNINSFQFLITVAFIIYF